MSDDTSIVTTLSALLVAMVSALIGNWFGKKNRVDEATCGERRYSCAALNNVKLESIHKDIKHLTELVERNHK